MASPKRGGDAKSLSSVVVYASSEDEGHAATELNRPAQSNTRGWQSAKLSEYPQEIGLRLDGEAHLAQLQLLAHQSKTPSRVEVFVATLAGCNPNAPPSYHEAEFQRLGFLTFRSNEHFKYRSRERKTVQLDVPAYFVKLIVHKCHVNPVNLYNQASLMQVCCFGQIRTHITRHVGSRGGDEPLPPVRAPGRSNLTAPTPPGQRPGQGLPARGPRGAGTGPPPPEINQYGDEDDDPYGYPPRAHGATPPPGAQPPQQTQQYEHVTTPPRQQQSAVSLPPLGPTPPQTHPEPGAPGGMNGLEMYRSRVITDFEHFYIRLSQELSGRKNHAVQTEDYSAAQDYKERLVFLQSQADRIYDLESQKMRAVFDENFDLAKALKGQIDSMCATTKTRVENPEVWKQPTPALSGKPPPPPVPAPSGRKQSHNGGRMAPGPDREEPGSVERSAPPANYDDVPVQSKYAAMMAARAATDDEEDEDEDEDEEEGADEDEDEAEEEEEEDDDDDEPAPAPPTKKNPKSSRRSQSQQADDPNTFNVAAFEQWEQDVYAAIHAEIGDEENPEPNAEPVAGVDSSTEFAMCFGQYTTACLFSKRYRLRDAALKVIRRDLGQLYTDQHAVQAVTCVLRYCDMKGFGILDTIPAVLITACRFISALVRGDLSGVSLPQVQTTVAGLLPRLQFRAWDSNVKVRDEALATILAIAGSAIGPEKVAATAMAEPVDVDKRRIGNPHARAHVTRLTVVQRLFSEGKWTRQVQVEPLMNRLLLPCLNHGQREVRDAALATLDSMDGGYGADALRFLSMVHHPTVRAQAEERLGVPAAETAPTQGESVDSTAPVPDPSPPGGSDPGPSTGPTVVRAARTGALPKARAHNHHPK